MYQFVHKFTMLIHILEYIIQ